MTQEQAQAKIRTILEDHNLYGVDFTDVCEAMKSVFELLANNLEETEPYATSTIKEYRQIAYRMDSDVIITSLTGE